MALKKSLAEKGLPCLSFSLNIPGFPKSNSVIKQFFELCLSDLLYYLKTHLIEIHTKESIEICDAAGDLFLVPCSVGNFGLLEIKQICENFEESHPLGRFIDVDLNDESGETISSGKSKSCFYCHEKPAIECRRERAHDGEELRSFMFGKMAKYVLEAREYAITKKLSSLALTALLREVSLTPKPGLVDKFSNGSHGDMNYQTFVDSSAAISCYFDELVRAGFNFSDKDRTKALPVIRKIGLQMEAAMFEATGNINTQKGIIFLIGLSLFTCGRLFKQNEHFEIELFSQTISEICKGIVQRELFDSSAAAKSHGEKVFRRFGFGGARAEAESGFETVINHGLLHLSESEKLNDVALLKGLLEIASVNNDTNILYRGGPAALAEFQRLCKNALENFNDINYSALAAYCKSENISPGGSADLLVVSIFLWSVMEAERSGTITTLSRKYDI